MKSSDTEKNLLSGSASGITVPRRSA